MCDILLIYRVSEKKGKRTEKKLQSFEVGWEWGLQVCLWFSTPSFTYILIVELLTLRKGFSVYLEVSWVEVHGFDLMGFADQEGCGVVDVGMFM